MKHMKRTLMLACLLFGVNGAQAQGIPNRLIDYDTFASQVSAVGQWRETRRITEEEFIRLSREPATVILDARSADKYGQLHVKNAKNLSLPDFTAEELARILPDKSTRILIYCNNNFLNAPGAFPSKAPSASLNIYTINVLHSYGYTNVYELGPLIDIQKAKIEFEGQQPVHQSASAETSEHR